MVRYPHKAKIISNNDTIVGGECVKGIPSDVEIIGRYEETGTSGRSILRLNAQGDEMIVKGEFYTKHRKIEGATSFEVVALGVSRPIVCWNDFQTYSVISV